MINMTIRKYEDTDFPVLEEWHRKIGSFIPSKHMLPAIGSIVEINGMPTCVGFLYLATDTPVGIIEWVLPRPDATPTEKHHSVTHVIRSLAEISISEGHPAVMLYSCRSITKVANQEGFAILDSNSNMSMYIGGN